MGFRAGLFGTVALVAAGLATAPTAHAEHWRGGHEYHHGGGNAAAAGIIGGIVGLGIGAAIASGGGYPPGYYAPPYSYYGNYGAPGSYYAPAPPPVYYGY